VQEVQGLTRAESRLRIALVLLGLLSLAFAIGYVLMGVLGDSEYPFVANSLTKDGFFAALCAIAVADIRRFSFTVVLVIGGHVLLVIALATALISGDTKSIDHTIVGPGLGAGTLVWVWLGAAAFIVVLFTWLYETAERARFGLRYLGHAEFRALAALAEVLVPGHEVSPERVAINVDHYLAGFPAQGKWKVRMALLGLVVYPLLWLRPPFTIMSLEMRRRFVERRFVVDVWDRRLPGPLRTLSQAMIRAAQQMAFLGFYGEARAAREVGYIPFSERPGAAAAIAGVHRPHPPLRCLTPRDVVSDVLHADAVVIGSGAGGAIAAYRLAEAGRSVLLLERGRHVDPSDFTESESEQLGQLYADGALTLSRDYRFQVAQGMCVGGSTVVNNGVCFDLPDRVLERWLDPDGFNTGLDADKLRASFKRLRAFLPVHEVKAGAALNPGGAKFVDGVQALGLDREPWKFGLVTCNIDDCLGCGYCNIGCAYGKKLSMLDNVLPRAQQTFGTDAVRVLAECAAQSIEVEGRRVTAVRCRLSDGRRITVRADTVVLAAGAVASSVILQRSGIAKGRAGRGLAFNMATPLTADFPDELHSERGLQITHYLEPPAEAGYALETWFNPIVTQALFMPGWFEQHRRNMERYAHMTCVGSVVGTKSNGSVRPALLGGGVTLDFTPDRQDVERVVTGLKLAGRIMLAAGALRVMVSSHRYLEFRAPDDLDALDHLLADDSDLLLNSAHPQGGNAICVDRDRGVVDSSLRVHDVDNLHVCDASVFPSSITVNPQLTVMALADYAFS
jgi:choline dehydrogenase-like flavoprotein